MGGFLHVATDVQAYAEHTVGVMETAETPEKLIKSPSSSSMLPWSPQSARESAQEEHRKRAVETCDEGNSRRADPPASERDATGTRGGSQWQQQQEEGERNTDAGLASDKVSARWIGGEVQERPPWRPLTRYEEKAREAGRRVWDFSYRLESSK